MGRRKVRWGVGAPREGSEGDGEACLLILSHRLSLGSVLRRPLRPSQVPRVVEPIFQVGPLRPRLAEVAGPQALRLKAAARDLELSLDWAGHEGCWTGGVLGAQQRTRWAAVSGRRFAQLGLQREARARPPPRPAARPRPGGGGRGGGPGRPGAAPPRLRPAPRRAQPGLGARGSLRATARRTDGQAAGRAERPAVSARRPPSRAGCPSPLPRRAPAGRPSPSSAWGPSDAPTVRRPRGCAPRAAGCPHPRPAAGSPSRPRSRWTDAGTEAGDGELGASGSAAGRSPPPAGSSAPQLLCCRPLPPLHPTGTAAPALLHSFPTPSSPSLAAPQLPPSGTTPTSGTTATVKLTSSVPPSRHTATHTLTPVARSSCTLCLGAPAIPSPHPPIPPVAKSHAQSRPPLPTISHTHAWTSHTRLPHTSLVHTRASHTGVSQIGTPLSQTVVSVLHACMSATRVSISHACLSHMRHTRVSCTAGVTVPHTLTLAHRVP